VHDVSAAEAIHRLGTDRDRGLATEEAESRLQRFGPNVLPRVERRGVVMRVLAQFHNPLIYTLLAAAAATYALGEPVDASVIVGVVIANAAIGAVQESRAERALDALTRMISVEARVVRDGRVRQVPATQLVRGDVVLLEPGDKVAADLRLLDDRCRSGRWTACCRRTCCSPIASTPRTPGHS
jgi:magnesium-transporting ATPase (P-type)